MLAADKAYLNAELTTELLRLRERELSYLIWHYNQARGRFPPTSHLIVTLLLSRVLRPLQIGIAASVLIGLAVQFVTAERVCGGVYHWGRHATPPKLQQAFALGGLVPWRCRNLAMPPGGCGGGG